jgi:hypothetical protein
LPTKAGKLNCGTFPTIPTVFYAVEGWRRQPAEHDLYQGAPPEGDSPAFRKELDCPDYITASA